ncbi:hypothetical protein BASA81_008080 [Batrachochytrium salamandrivorans]|nr:hypothetical protein BASA81_008080 [Batrachochytrium salamandrivorans]
MADPNRHELYTAHELSFKSDEGRTLDETIMHEIATQEHTLAVEQQRLQHDANLLWQARKLLGGRKVCGFMGGHRRVMRGSKEFATCAKLALLLAQSDCVILQGGGPGAMEAAALGAYFSQFDLGNDKLDLALDILALAPDFTDQKNWLAQANEVLNKFPSTSNKLLSLGVPTWVYGHEPSNLFSTQLCKCFNNALREEFLTKECNHTVYFFPGSMGTFQEAFQVGCLVHYNLSHTRLVFVGKEFWTKEIQLYPMLEDWASKQGKGKWEPENFLLSLQDEDQLLKLAVRVKD